MFPTPTGGASLLLSFSLNAKTTLIIGSGTLAAKRAFAALEADSQVIVLTNGSLCDELAYRAMNGQVVIVEWNSLPGLSHIQKLQLWLPVAVSFLCVTDTVAGSDDRRSPASAKEIYDLCQSRHILVNITDMPEFCDFSFASTHRFSHNGEPTPLQIGVTTNGQGCRLAGRLKRDIVARLPKQVGLAVKNVGKLRTLAKADDSEDGQASTPNLPVSQRQLSIIETALEGTKRRIKWIAQVSEYWPISKLASLSPADMDQVLAGDTSLSFPLSPSLHNITFPGRIILAGSGPGHPSLLTLATYAALTRSAHLVLSDKLVPESVLSLIPSSMEIRIAKKFPGNAERAQTEMMEAAVEAARQGLTVVRLKQGDPAVYGRAGEEILYFREAGFEPIVIPGVSSAIAAPLFAGIPVTQRGAAESFIVCTGVGRGGKQVKLPGYERSRTLVLLMGVARLDNVVGVLCDAEVDKEKRNGDAYPCHTPITLIERGSMPDQRVISSTLTDIAQALESVGEQRPPGMLVIGWAVPSLWDKGQVDVLDQQHGDDERVARWLGGERWRITEGMQDGWQMFDNF